MRFAVFAFFQQARTSGADHRCPSASRHLLRVLLWRRFNIFVDAVFPHDNPHERAKDFSTCSFLAAGLVIANFWFGSLKAKWTNARGRRGLSKTFSRALVHLALRRTEPEIRNHQSRAKNEQVEKSLRARADIVRKNCVHKKCKASQRRTRNRCREALGQR